MINLCNRYVSSHRIIRGLIKLPGNVFAIRAIRRHAGLMAKCKRELIEVHHFPEELFKL